jgi:hypothetical protein
MPKVRRKKPIEKVRSYLDRVMRTATKRKRKVLKGARAAMERLYGR